MRRFFSGRLFVNGYILKKHEVGQVKTTALPVPCGFPGPLNSLEWTRGLPGDFFILTFPKTIHCLNIPGPIKASVLGKYIPRSFRWTVDLCPKLQTEYQFSLMYVSSCTKNTLLSTQLYKLQIPVLLSTVTNKSLSEICFTTYYAGSHFRLLPFCTDLLPLL